MHAISYQHFSFARSIEWYWCRPGQEQWGVGFVWSQWAMPCAKSMLYRYHRMLYVHTTETSIGFLSKQIIQSAHARNITRSTENPSLMHAAFSHYFLPLTNVPQRKNYKHRIHRILGKKFHQVFYTVKIVHSESKCLMTHSNK